jgi:hypothetical protein
MKVSLWFSWPWPPDERTFRVAGEIDGISLGLGCEVQVGGFSFRLRGLRSWKGNILEFHGDARLGETWHPTPIRIRIDAWSEAFAEQSDMINSMRKIGVVDGDLLVIRAPLSTQSAGLADSINAAIKATGKKDVVAFILEPGTSLHALPDSLLRSAGLMRIPAEEPKPYSCEICKQEPATHSFTQRLQVKESQMGDRPIDYFAKQVEACQSCYEQYSKQAS